MACRLLEILIKWSHYKGCLSPTASVRFVLNIHILWSSWRFTLCTIISIICVQQRISYSLIVKYLTNANCSVTFAKFRMVICGRSFTFPGHAFCRLQEPAGLHCAVSQESIPSTSVVIPFLYSVSFGRESRSISSWIAMILLISDLLNSLCAMVFHSFRSIQQEHTCYSFTFTRFILYPLQFFV